MLLICIEEINMGKSTRVEAFFQACLYNCKRSHSSVVALAALRSTERSRTWKKEQIRYYDQEKQIQTSTAPSHFFLFPFDIIFY
uniref:Uncharacterized protein n=1 Tax=Lotus japonicus TaxID=34305 RepID=I3S1S1_LOTJA|nr:unknown [Lotus japonicus]